MRKDRGKETSASKYAYSKQKEVNQLASGDNTYRMIVFDKTSFVVNLTIMIE